MGRAIPMLSMFHARENMGAQREPLSRFFFIFLIFQRNLGILNNSMKGK